MKFYVMLSESLGGSKCMTLLLNFRQYLFSQIKISILILFCLFTVIFALTLLRLAICHETVVPIL